MNTDFNWNQEGALDDLKRLHEGGYSCSQIALELSAAFTGTPSRNAVIGKLFRLGLVSKHGHGRPAVNPTPERRERFKATSTKRPPPHRNYSPVPTPPQPIDLPPTQSDCAVTLVDLEQHHCRWPVSEPAEMMFCGVRKHGDYPYCIKHVRMAYQPRGQRLSAPAPFKEYRRRA